MKRSIAYFLGFITLVVTNLIFFRRILIALALKIPMPKHRVLVERDLHIVADDGIRLITDHYLPTRLDAPTILIRSPYGRNAKQSSYGRIMEFFANRFAERGYHVLVQDVRGRFDSEGEFAPYLNEKADGLATVAWLRQQSWFNGKLCLWGASYLGISQWVIAHEIPEVKAIMPIFTASQLYPILFPDDVLNYGLVTRWMSILKRLDDLYQKRSLIYMLLYPMYVEQATRKARLHLPLMSVDELLLGQKNTFFQLLEGNTESQSPLWQEINAMVNVAKVQASVHLIGGWYDFFLRQQLKDYHTLKQAGKQPYLTIGKWMHFNNANGLIAGIQEGLPFFDHCTRDKATRLRENPVRVFVMGADEWRDLPDFPPPTRAVTVYLGDQSLSQTASEIRTQKCYDYDPAHPTPAIGGAQFTFDTFPVKDNRRLQKRADVLTFTSENLEQPVEIMGEAKVILYVQSTAESADFFARLCDVTPDGCSLNIADGLHRIVVGANNGVHCIEITLFPTAYQFRPNHRIQLMVASAFHPHWTRNLGTTEAYCTSIEMKCATQTIFFGGDTPSHLILPVSS